MPTVDLRLEEIAYILNTLATRQYALERYTEIKGPEALVTRELALLKSMVEKLTQPDEGNGNREAE
jgi:hypothetical protein